MSEAVFPRRDWISAQASYEGQAANLVAMVDRLLDQAPVLATTRPKRVSIVGIGASHAAAASAVYDMRRHGLDALRFLPSELPAGLSGPDGLTVLVSQSGRSAEVVELARQASGQAKPQPIIALTNYTPSPLGMLCESEINLGNFSDSSVSFVTFTGTMLALQLLADTWNGRHRPRYWKKVIETAIEAVERQDAMLAEIAAMMLEGSSTDIVAPAPLMSVAEETSLMLREGPRMFATAMETRQYLHGPMDAAGPGSHLVIGGEREAALLSQLSEKTQRLAFITDDSRRDMAGSVPSVHLSAELSVPVAFAIASTFATQKITLHAARIRGVEINEAAFKRLDTKIDSLTKTS